MRTSNCSLWTRKTSGRIRVFHSHQDNVWSLRHCWLFSSFLLRVNRGRIGYGVQEWLRLRQLPICVSIHPSLELEALEAHWWVTPQEQPSNSNWCPMDISYQQISNESRQLPSIFRFDRILIGRVCRMHSLHTGLVNINHGRGKIGQQLLTKAMPLSVVSLRIKQNEVCQLS